MISTYLADKLLNHVIGATSYTAPPTVYVALFITMPDAGGSGAVEPSIGDYGRVAVTNDPTNWPNATLRQKFNANDIEFIQATDDWGLILGAGLYDDLTVGNLLVFGLFDEPIDLNLNDKLTFNASVFQISFV